MRPTLLTLSFVFIAFGGRLQHSDSAPASRQRVEGETSLPASVRVIGRVLDEEKNGLANVIVGLNYRYHSKTGADGRFVIEAPGPAADLVSFHISPPIYYGKHSREFGFAVSRHQDPLRVGINDLGDMILPLLGAAAGRIVNEEGLPVSDARVGDSKTNENGEYEITKPFGIISVHAEAKGYLHGHINNVEIKRGKTTSGVDFILKKSPTISGRVVDTNNNPIVNIEVVGWPDESGSSARSLTSEDGSFCLYLPQKSSYRLETGASFEFMAYEESDSSPAHPPGTRDIKIVLQKTPSRNLYVVDAETSAPIQQFGIGPSGDGTKWPEIKNHPNGEYKLSLAPFARFAVFAPGYAPKIASVPALNDNIIVRMLKPGKLVGKANFNNKACAGLVIEVAPAESERRDDNFQSRVIDDAQDGRFAIDGLPPGIYNLYLRGRSTAPRRLTRLQIVAGATVDVGEVNLEFAGSIRGELLVDDKFSGKRLTVELNNNDALNTIDREYETIGGGTFSFTALEASEYLLTITYWVESENGGSSSGTTLGTRFKFKLRSGEDKKITIDMRSNNSANFTILTNAANRPVYWPIVLFHPEDAQFPERNAGEIQSGGAITGTVPPGRYTIKLYSQWFIPLARTGIINLLKDHKNEIVIDAMVGGLIVELPKDKNIYEVGEFPIRLDGTYNNEPWTTTITLGGTGTNSFWLWPMDPEVGRRFSINEIPPGRVKLFVNNQKDPIHEIDIRAGETSTREIPAPAVENK